MNDRIDSIMESAIYRGFDRIEEVRELREIPPSEVETYLSRYWDLGDFYRDWWMESGEEWR